MKLLTRKFLLRLIIPLLSITAVLGIISVLWTGLGETGARILGSAIAADLASVLALCCAAPPRSASHRAVQVTGILSACLGLITGIYVIWQNMNSTGLAEDIARAAVALFILAVASAHAALVLSWRPPSRPARAVVAGTLLCIAAAAELIANYVMFPSFDPGSGYARALAVVLILDALGTILILVLHRCGPSRSGAAPAEATTRPSPNPSDAKLPAVP
jgi:hypothetical protein